MTYKCRFRGTDLRASGNFGAALRICICCSLVKFSRSRAALWLATLECSFSTRGDRRRGADVETVNHSTLNARRRIRRREAFRTVEANFARCSRALLAALVRCGRKRLQRPGLLASGIKWDFTGARSAATLRRIPRWRKQQLRNAKSPPCRRGSARFTSELRVGERAVRVRRIHVLAILNRRPEKYRPVSR